MLYITQGNNQAWLWLKVVVHILLAIVYEFERVLENLYIFAFECVFFFC